MKNMRMRVSLPVSIIREGKKFVAYSPALDLSTSGNNYDQVKKRFQEIVEVFFEELVKKNTLGVVLADLGWQKERSNWVPPVVISNEMQSVSLAHA